MSPRPGTKEALLRENAELRARLEDAEETLRAIRSGEVDALVLDEGIYTLESAESAYRFLVEAMNEGAASISGDGAVLYCNLRLAALLATPLNNLIGTHLRDFVATSDRAAFDALLDLGRQHQRRGEITFVATDGRRVPVQISCSAFGTHGVRGLCLVATDLTQEKANEEMVENERLARSILDQAGDAIVVCDPEGTILRASREAVRLAGRNCLLEPFAEAFPLDMADGGEALMARLRSDAEVRSLEARMGPPNAERWLVVSAARLAGKTLLGWVISMADITDLRRADAERKRLLAETSERAAETEAILVAQSDAVLMYDTDRTVRRVNPSFLAAYGFDPVGLNVEEIIRRVECRTLDGRPLLLEEQPTPRALRGERTAGELFLVKRADGADAVVETSSGPLVEGDRIAGSVTVWHDVSDRMRSEAALRASEVRYRSLFESMTEGFGLHEVICDEEGKPCDYRFLDVNPAFERLTGLRREDVVGKTHNEVLPDDDPRWVREYGNVALTGQAIRFENYSPALKRHYEVVAYQTEPGRFAVIFTDISKRKQMELELKRANELLETITKGTEVIIAAVDSDLRYTYFNEAYKEEIRRLSGKDISVGTKMADLFADSPDQQKIAVEAWSRVLRGESTSRQLDFGDPGRYRRAYSSRQAPIRDAEGNVVGAGEVALDVTKQVQAEQALRDSEERYRVLVESAPDAVIVHRDGRFVYANSAALRLYGAGSFEELQERPVLDLIHPDERPAIAARMRLGEEGQSLPLRETRALRLDGTVVLCESVGGVVTYQGKPAVQIMIRDITERKQAEEVLRETRDYLENLFGYANAPIIVWDTDLRITRFNRAFERLTGRRAEDVIGKHLELLFPEESRGEWLGHIQRTTAGERWEVVEIPIVRVDGSVRTVLWNSATILDADATAVVATMAQGQDITERKRAEEALAGALEEAQRRAEEVSALLMAARAALEQPSFDAAARVILDSCKKLLGAPSGFVARTESEGSKHQIIWADSEALSRDPDFHLPQPVRSMFAEAYRSRRPVVAKSIPEGERGEVLTPWLGEAENVLLAPLLIGEGGAGLIGLSNKPGGFTDDDARLAGAFAEMASVALLNSKAAELLRRDHEALERLVGERTARLQEANESLNEEIAERTRTEAQLRVSQGRFRDLFENVFDGVYETGAGQEFKSVNNALVGMLGYGSKEETVTALNANEVWTDREKVAGLWRKLGTDGSLRGEEITLRRRDGSLLEGLININAVRNERGDAVAYQGTVSDITALKRAEEALEAERLRLKSVLETMQDSVCIIGRDLGVEYVNPAAERQFGTIDGRPCYAYLYGREEPCPWCHNERVFSGAQLSWEWVAPDTGRTYEAFATRLQNADGSFSKLEIFHDVSERKEAERAARAERERFFGVLDQLPVFVYLRAEDHSVVFANRYFRDEFGDPAGKPCFQILNRGDSPCEGCDYARVFKERETVEWEWTAPNRKSYQVHHYPFTDSDGSRLVLALGVDITERKLAYEAEQVSRRMAETLRETSLALTRTLDVDTVLCQGP